MPELHFTERYCETVRLRDNTPISLRLVRPGDKLLLQKGLRRMSADSRYRRFLGAKNQLTDAELAYLTECDGIDHLAIGAVTRTADGSDEGLGVARFIRSKTDRGAAEAAIAVVDDWQNRGIGTLLLLRLAAAAKERGIERFQARTLAQNLPIREILRQLGPSVRMLWDADEILVEIDIPDVPWDAQLDRPERRTPLREVLALAAKGAFFAQRMLTRREDVVPSSAQTE